MGLPNEVEPVSDEDIVHFKLDSSKFDGNLQSELAKVENMVNQVSIALAVYWREISDWSM